MVSSGTHCGPHSWPRIWRNYGKLSWKITTNKNIAKKEGKFLSFKVKGDSLWWSSRVSCFSFLFHLTLEACCWLSGIQNFQVKSVNHGKGKESWSAKQLWVSVKYYLQGRTWSVSPVPLPWNSMVSPVPTLWNSMVSPVPLPWNSMVSPVPTLWNSMGKEVWDRVCVRLLTVNFCIYWKINSHAKSLKKTAKSSLRSWTTPK